MLIICAYALYLRFKLSFFSPVIVFICFCEIGLTVLYCSFFIVLRYFRSSVSKFFLSLASNSVILLFILVIVPDIVLAIAFLLLFRTINVPLGFWSLLIAHITFCLPFVFVTLNSRLSSTNPFLVEAARDLGASESKIFFRVLVPLLLPGLLAGWLLSFTLSLDDVIISYFVTGPSFQILPLKIFAMVRLGVSPEINALCTLLLGFTIIIVLISQLALRKKW